MTQSQIFKQILEVNRTSLNSTYTIINKVKEHAELLTDTILDQTILADKQFIEQIIGIELIK